jgi:dTDP-4-amino-4,6-dideoxygalactose transaminase
LGTYTERFEQSFAAVHSGVSGPKSANPAAGVSKHSPAGEPPHAVATSSGTSALEIIFRALGVAGRDVIIPANTFYATAAAAIAAGARPVFADVDAATFALSPQTLTSALTADTAAAVLVHIGGLITPQADELRRLCQDIGVALVEDAAHAHGSTLDGRFAGSFGVAAAFSFYPTKVVTAGEGGMILTGSADLAQEARIYRDQGKGSFGVNEHVRLGYAWRMSELNAAAGLVHLRRLGEFITRRREIAAAYNAGLAGAGFLSPLAEPAGCEGNVYKYIALLPPGTDRTWFKRELADRYQVRLAGEVYDLPLHLQPVLAQFATGHHLPVAEDICGRHVCLPVHSDMGAEEVDEVLAAITAVSKECMRRQEGYVEYGQDAAQAQRPQGSDGEHGDYGEHACASW